MSGGTFLFAGHPVAFHDGETIAAALAAEGVFGYGRDPAGRDTRYFCGIGACQGCLVGVAGRLVEACLTPAEDGLRAEPATAGPGTPIADHVGDRR